MEGNKGKFIAGGSDSSIKSPLLKIESWAVRNIVVKMAIHGPSENGHVAEIYWRGKEENKFTESQKISVPVIADGKEHEYVFQVGGSFSWLMCGVIHQIRLDPVNSPAEIEISSIIIIPVSKTQ
jgi:hypothetical protein